MSPSPGAGKPLYDGMYRLVLLELYMDNFMGACCRRVFDVEIFKRPSTVLLAWFEICDCSYSDVLNAGPTIQHRSPVVFFVFSQI